MKKKSIALLSLAAVATLALASCDNKNKDDKPTAKPTDGPVGTTTAAPAKKTDLDIYINYTGTAGITARDEKVNSVEGKNYAKGDLLPTWVALGEKMNANIREATAYKDKNDADSYKTVKANGYASEINSANKIDLFYNTTANINTMGAAGEAVDLMPYIEQGYMPNFAAWLEQNPTQKTAIMKGKAIYYTPYYDGYQDIERMFVMDTALVEAVLDAADYSAFDTTVAGKGAAANQLQENAYTPFIYDGDSNYAADQTVKISKIAKGSTITIKKTTSNIIKAQNAALAAGTTGKALAEQFKAYLTEAFGDLVGAGKTYEHYSEIFTSEAAAYNTDELIALMRVIKANPGVITGDPTKEVEIIFPRAGANNRVDNIADFLQIWGVQGMTSKHNMDYFTADGNLNDAATTKQTYDALERLSALYDEGLIVEEFWNAGASGVQADTKTGYLNKYFGKTAFDGGYGFMMYDYAASTGATNKKVDGIGTDESKVLTGYTVRTGVRPVVSPLTYWATGTDFNVDQDLTDKTGKELIRYYEENRALKSNAWCIPDASDNKAAAVRLMDYLMGAEGVMIQDFGPDGGKYWTLGTEADGALNGYPKMTDAMKNWMGTYASDFWSFMREFVGSTHGVGHIRETAIQIQSCNSYAQVGLNNIENAILGGAIEFNLVNKSNGKGNTWDTTVPTAGYASVSTEAAKAYADLTAFWASDKYATTANGWAAVVAEKAGALNATSTKTIGANKDGADYSYKSAYDQIAKKNEVYLYTTAESINAIPSYLKK